MAPAQANGLAPLTTRLVIRSNIYLFAYLPHPIPGEAASIEESIASQKANLDARLIAANPMPMWGETEDIGNVAAFLCSPKARYLTGVVIPVDGGLHMGRGA